jgi:hypothetical protein
LVKRTEQVWRPVHLRKPLCGSSQNALLQALNSRIQIPLGRCKVCMAGDFHQLMIGELAGFAETTERLMSQIVPVQIDLS